MNTPLEIGTVVPKMTVKGKVLFSFISGFLFATSFVLIEDFDIDQWQFWSEFLIRWILWGLMFGFGFNQITKLLPARIHFKKPKHFDAIEQAIAKGPTNCLYGKEAVGGELFLTTEKLVFVPHGFNFQTKVSEIYLNEIESLEKAKTLGLLNNKLEIRTASKTYAFLLIDRATWLNVIKGQIPNLTNDLSSQKLN